MTGIVDFRTELLDENGNPITGLNPLPTTGGGALSDVLLTDSTGALFVGRDDGTSVTYFNLNTNAAYTPVGTIYAAPVVASNANADTLLEGLQTLLIRLLNATNSPRGYDVALGRNRVTALLESGTVTTVSNVANQTLMGGTQAQLLSTGQNVSAWAATVRSRIT